MGKHLYGIWGKGRKTGRFGLLAVSLGVATLASMLSGLPVQPARADPIGSPVYRALSGVGSATTQDLMDALSDVVTVNGQKVLASYKTDPGASRTITTKNPATHPDCTLNRPAGDAGGQSALGYSIGVQDGCLDFARLAGEPIKQSISPIANVTYRPYALDGITFVTNRRTALLGKSLDFLRDVFTCGASATTWHPLLPASGSQLRSEWLAALDIREEDVSGGKYPCVRDTIAGVPNRENDVSLVAADQAAIMPISIGQFVAHGWPDIRMGKIQPNGGPPVLPNNAAFSTAFPNGVSYTTHASSNLPDMTSGELKDLYQCRITKVRGIPATPLLPMASWVRSAWLKRVDITEADITTGLYPCIRTTLSDGSPIPVDDGQPLYDEPSQGSSYVIPHSIDAYIHQMIGYSGVAADKRYGRVLGGIAQDGKVVKRPFVLNSNYSQPLVRRLYNVIPVDKQRTSPWREVFTGATSLICQNAAIIETYGFVPLGPDSCGGGDQELVDPASPSYQIRNIKSGKCVAIDGASTADAARAVQQTCGSGPEQRWTWHGTTVRQLKNTRSGKCLAIRNGSITNGAQAIQMTCGSGTEQQWILQADPAGSESHLMNTKSSLLLSVSGGGSTANGAQLVQWTADNSPEKDWTLQTATTVSPGVDTLMDTTTLTATTSSATVTGATAIPAPVGKAAIAAAAVNQWVTVIYPKRLVDIRNGRCRFQGYWSQKGARPGSEPIGGSFFETRGYLVGPKCAVSMHLQVINYKRKNVGIFVADHYVDAGKPSSPGKNERWMFWGPLGGGSYQLKIGNVPYLLSYTLKDLTTGGVASVGQIWGPKANWCDGWPGPGACPTTT
ncbi:MULTISPECIES: RICIN domain-containing protein [unclassified Streptosporangium]|uniref:RICIN domain-containing protein n=1 Tax=unclassified Streptosporangium TaxID=2632669 RepID=UPI002E29FFA6|nr:MULTISPECIES: RICIN domain-containing protein [unclassified Streptosporangium]